MVATKSVAETHRYLCILYSTNNNFMTCKDQSLTFLNGFGYNVVRAPKVDIQPLQLLIREKGIMKNLGELASLLNVGDLAPLPGIKRDKQMANISGSRTSDLSAGVGISILGNIIGAMGGSKLGLEAKYAQAKTISFEFADVLEDSLEIVMLDQFLAGADVNPLSRFVANLLEADDIFVITAVIKSQSISVLSKKKNDTAVVVSVPEIKEIVGGNVDVSTKSGSESTITFSGKVPLVFGFQAIQLTYEDGQYKTFKHLKPGGGAVSFSAAATAGSNGFHVFDQSFVQL